MSRGWEAAAELLNLRVRPTVIMCASDRCALGVLRYCREQGVRVPEDVSLVGFDNLGPAVDAVPALTTVRHPVSEMGGEATDMMIDLLEGRSPDPLRMVESGFIVRKTTGPAV
jgi:LacI family transcriptional regulator